MRDNVCTRRRLISAGTSLPGVRIRVADMAPIIVTVAVRVGTIMRGNIRAVAPYVTADVNIRRRRRRYSDDKRAHNEQ